MEKTMSVEDRIKRAEEIYARRQGRDIGKRTTISANNKRSGRQFKRLIKEIFLCLFIYLVFLTIKNSEYIFSKEFLDDVNRVLSYRTNISELGNNIKNNLIKTLENMKEQNGIGGANEDTTMQENTTANESKLNSKIESESNIAEQNQINEQVTENENQNTIGKENGEQQGETEEEKEIADIKATTSFIKPIEGKISSTFGMRNPTTSTVPKNHTGVDIAANMGTKIKSSTPGEVVLASEEGDFGKHLKIQIGKVSVIYAHCNKLYVKEGDKIEQGQEIAEVGSTGNSTGPHLHFEIRLSEKSIDPQKILEL